MDALAKLYTYDRQFDKTLEIWLKLKRGNVFELIRQHNLYDSIHDKVVLLMEFDREKAVDILVSNADKIPIPQVCPPPFCYSYSFLHYFSTYIYLLSYVCMF